MSIGAQVPGQAAEVLPEMLAHAALGRPRAALALTAAARASLDAAPVRLDVGQIRVRAAWGLLGAAPVPGV